MKILLCFGAAFAAFLPSVHADFVDSFAGATLDLSHWSPSTFASDSSVAVSGGDLVLSNRGRVLTNQGFSGTVDVLMAFRFTGSLHDDLHVALRTDGTSTNLSGEFDSGLFANFSMQSDTGSPTGNISLGSYDYPNSSAGILSLGTFSMVQNQTYLVRILDDGTNVSLFVNNLIIPFLTASSTASYGNQIGFYDREGAGAGSFISAGSQVKVDFFSVTGSPEEVASVPEGGMTAAFLGLSCVVMGCALRKHQ